MDPSRFPLETSHVYNSDSTIPLCACRPPERTFEVFPCTYDEFTNLTRLRLGLPHLSKLRIYTVNDGQRLRVRRDTFDNAVADLSNSLVVEYIAAERLKDACARHRKSTFSSTKVPEAGELASRSEIPPLSSTKVKNVEPLPASKRASSGKVKPVRSREPASAAALPKPECRSLRFKHGVARRTQGKVTFTISIAPSNDEFKIRCSPSMRVATFKKYVCAVRATSPRHCRLFFGNQILIDSKTLADQGVRGGADILFVPDRVDIE